MISPSIAVTTALFTLIVTVIAQLQPRETGRSCSWGKVNNGNFCIPCPPRMISSGSNVFQCTLCTKKGEFPAGDLTYCDKCGPGDIPNEQQVCEPCPLDTYTETFNAPKCIPCPLWKHTDYTAGSSKRACSGCGSGKGEVEYGVRRICLCCDRGQFSFEGPKTKHRSCNSWPMSMTAGRCNDSCRMCPVGTSGHLKGFGIFQQALCYRCKGTKYADEPGSKFCKQCPKGSISSPDGGRCIADCNPASPGCYACGRGTEPNGLGGCRKCTVGTANMFVSLTKCVPCPAPLIPSKGRDMCICRGEKVWNENKRKCEGCPPKTTFKGDGIRRCVCSNGKVLENKKCICPGGQKPKGDGCILCTAAERASNDDKCTLCKRDELFDSKKKKCVACPEGRVKDIRSLKLLKWTKCLATHRMNGMLICGCEPGSRWVVNNCMKCPAGTALMG